MGPLLKRPFASLFFLVILALFTLPLTACGAHNSARGVAYGTASSASTSYISANAALAECNNVNTTINLTGQVSTYYQAGVFVPNILLLNVTAAPQQLFSSSTASIEIVPYSESTSGAKTYGPASDFLFMDKLTGQMTSNPIGNLSYATIQAALKQLGLTSSIPASEFFSRVYVVILGMDTTYDAATVEYFDSTSGAGPLSQSNFLLPIFYANPAVYAQYKPVADLEQLHPFWSYQSSGYSDAQFGQLDNQICQQMSTGGRVPASVGDMDGVDMVSASQYLKGFLHTAAGARFDHSNFMARAWVRYGLPVWQKVRAVIRLL